ncbi:hypothetical protein ATK74_1228 [Propionicimonas paludicola]|uniref:DUF7455 domain-containing protein n=1 Tax=Propionicimonas paludicola TaxID=185243 RepID=A0A2A9CQC9_9ACTN|nr:hypothetical protein [Propionicimonas paludicola]PFG16677.1 hypothetical protein ATK74_1228 [Propionicimonas paludicola]
MGTYDENLRGAAPPVANFAAGESASRRDTCDLCVAPSVAVVVIGEEPSALSLQFCGHHLTQHLAKLTDGGHQVLFHK